MASLNSTTYTAMIHQASKQKRVAWSLVPCVVNSLQLSVELRVVVRWFCIHVIFATRLCFHDRCLHRHWLLLHVLDVVNEFL